MKRMEIKGIDFAYITLHAGLGNFRDIDVEDLTKHKTDSEQMIVTEEAVKVVNRAKDLSQAGVCRRYYGDACNREYRQHRRPFEGI